MTGGGTVVGGGMVAGGAAVGGGSVSGGGAPSNCEVVGDLLNLNAMGTYRATTSGTQRNWRAGSVAQLSTPAGVQFASIRIDLYHALNMVPTFPLTRMIRPGGWLQSDEPIFFKAGDCDMMGDGCRLDFLAQSGSVTYSTGVANMASGTFAGEARNLVFQNWNLTTDTPVPNGPCVTINRVSWNATWP